MPRLTPDTTLRRSIEKSDLTLAELGRIAKVDRSSISRYVRGERDLTFAAASRLMQVLGLRVVQEEENVR
jgi:plasmid maintenance system antidote protein VapI